MRSRYVKNKNAWNMVYRVCTERARRRILREWDEYAWARYLGWGVRTKWDTVYSVVAKLTGMDFECLTILFEVLSLEHLRHVFYEMKSEKRRDNY